MRAVDWTAGELFPPAYGRRYWTIIVRRCPSCAYMHVHRTPYPGVEFTRVRPCGGIYAVRCLPVGVMA